MEYYKVKKKVIKLCISEWVNESRDKRELSVLKELKTEVSVIAKGKITGKQDVVDGYRVTRVSTRPLGNSIPDFLNRSISVFTWAHFVRKMEADIISGHDITALLIGYLSNIGKPGGKKAKLVYDSHEFEIGRCADRNKLTAFFILHLERFLIKRSVFSIMVNDSIADEVQKIHKLKKRPIVVRSIPDYWNIDKNQVNIVRKNILQKLKMDEDTFIVMYHGMAGPYRGIENIMKAVAELENTAAVILGNGDKTYLSKLHAYGEKLGISRKIFIHDAVPVDELYKYVCASNVGMVIGRGIYKSYFYMLPNKFFENIHGLTPVIVSDFPEVGKLTEEYGIGLKVNPESVNEIIDAVKKMQSDKKFYQQCKDNLKIAKEELCWEKEKQVLKKAYNEVLNE